MLPQVTASSPGNSGNVSDTADDGDDTDGNTTDDPTIVEVFSGASMKVVKTAIVVDNGDNSVGTNDKIVYTITIRNTGSVNLTNLSFVDNLTDGNSAVLSLDSSPILASASAGSNSQTILSGGVISFTATYTISQQANDSGSIRNSVTATAK